MMEPFSSQEEMQKDFKYLIKIIEDIYPSSWSQQLWHLEAWCRHLEEKIQVTLKDRQNKGLNKI